MIKTTRSAKMKKPFPWFYIAIGALALVVLVLAITTLVYYRKSAQQKIADNVAEQSIVTPVKVEQLLEKVSKLMTLPTSETPTIATVADPEKLKSQPFFAEAKVGDRVLIYPQAHQAILYRPSENKIIGVGPFSANVTSTRP